MKIKDQTFTSGNTKVGLKEVLADILENMPSEGGVAAARAQVDAAKRIKESNGEMDLSPEDVVLLRSLVNRARHLPPAIQVSIYDALDPKEEGPSE